MTCTGTYLYGTVVVMLSLITVLENQCFSLMHIILEMFLFLRYHSEYKLDASLTIRDLREEDLGKYR